MPNRREPVTKDIVFIEKGVPLRPDNRYTATVNGFILGLQARFRLTEWTQDRTYLSKHGTCPHNIDGSSSAFFRLDFKFRDNKGKYPNHK